MLLKDYRASKILYNFLLSNKFKNVFLLPSNVCSVVPLTFIKANVKFEFVDISLLDYCIDSKVVEKLVSNNPEKYSGIIFVRTYGIEDSFSDFFVNLKKIKKDFVVIDDKCLCRPSLHTPQETSVDLTLYSTGYAKYLDINQGGFAFLNPRNNFSYNQYELHLNTEDYKSIMDDVKKSSEKNKLFEYNSSLNWLGSREIDLEYPKNIFSKLDAIDQHKATINDIYLSRISNEFLFDDKFMNWRFNLLLPIEKRDEVLQNIFANNLFASAHYSSLSHIMGNKNSVNAEYLSRRVINLFNDFNFSEEQAHSVCDLINSTLGKGE